MPVPVIPDHASLVRPRRQSRLVYLFRGRRRHRQTAARHQYIDSVKSALGCCRFVTDEVRRQIRYSFAGWRPIQGGWLSSCAPGPQLDAKAVFRPRSDRGGYHPRCRNQPRGRLAARARQGQPCRQRAVRTRRRRPLDQPDVLFGADAGKAAALEPARTALHRPGDRSPVRRLSRPDLCRARCMPANCRPTSR